MRLRIIEILNKLTFHLLREDGLGGLWDGDGSLNFTSIAQRQQTSSSYLLYDSHISIQILSAASESHTRIG